MNSRRLSPSMGFLQGRRDSEGGALSALLHQDSTTIGWQTACGTADSLLHCEISVVLTARFRSARGQRVTLPDGLARSASTDCGLSGTWRFVLLSANTG